MLWAKNMAQLQIPVRHGDVFLVLQKRRLGASSLRSERTCDICFSKGREGKEKSKEGRRKSSRMRFNRKGMS